MMTETMIAKKRVVYDDKNYLLLYRLISGEAGTHGIEIACASEEETERETVFLNLQREETVSLIRLLSEHLVFPVSLKETLENYL